MNQPFEHKTCWTRYVSAEKLIRAEEKRNSKAKFFLFLFGLAFGLVLGYSWQMV